MHEISKDDNTDMMAWRGGFEPPGHIVTSD